FEFLRWRSRSLHVPGRRARTAAAYPLRFDGRRNLALSAGTQTSRRRDHWSARAALVLRPRQHVEYLVPEGLRRPLPRPAGLSLLRFRSVVVWPQSRLGKGPGEEGR